MLHQGVCICCFQGAQHIFIVPRVVWLCVVGLSRLTCGGFVQGQCFSFVWAYYSSPRIFGAAILYRSSSLRWRYKQWLCVLFKKKIRANLGCHICMLSSMEIVRHQGRPASGELCIRGVRHQGRLASGASCIGGVMHKGS
jgi:hypothetical protein